MSTISKQLTVESGGVYAVMLTAYVTKEITVYTAASDTLTYTGLDGNSHTITSNTSGRATTSITALATGSTFTFTSTVAKNPSNLSANYTKEITIDENTTSIYVMPEGAVYWYGFEKYPITTYSSGSGGGNGIIKKTNYIEVTSSGSYANVTRTTNAISLTGYTKAKFLVSRSAYNPSYPGLCRFGIGSASNDDSFNSSVDAPLGGPAYYSVNISGSSAAIKTYNAHNISTAYDTSYIYTMYLE